MHSEKKLKAPAVGSHPKIVEFAVKYVSLAEKQGIVLYPFEFYRSPERSDRLFELGVSKAKGGESPHNYGLAVDVVHATRYWELSRKEWDLLGAIGKEAARRCGLKVKWGGEFRSIYDPAHWEILDWRDYRSLLKDYPNLFGNFAALDQKLGKKY